MGRIQLLMGSPDGPSLMVGKILWSRRGRNGLKKKEKKILGGKEKTLSKNKKIRQGAISSTLGVFPVPRNTFDNYSLIKKNKDKILGKNKKILEDKEKTLGKNKKIRHGAISSTLRKDKETTLGKTINGRQPGKKQEDKETTLEKTINKRPLGKKQTDKETTLGKTINKRQPDKKQGDKETTLRKTINGRQPGSEPSLSKWAFKREPSMIPECLKDMTSLTPGQRKELGGYSQQPGDKETTLG
ncbi:hypothetical protein FH972_002793 [Carpinus fangiana]|uniref:Uncharacterized protein n=1 Tax=Carpinus fangiana TaxID=176857 RepID=A0A5N6QFY4_9ROSI|nr:hypothetical protein FH972_002793 [Carpinus fangiana]